MTSDRHIDIMGIVNLTEDSFYGESRCGSVESALDRIAGMLEEGADIIDIGACSTRPGASQIGPEEEWKRLEPVLKAVREAYPDIRLSIDTVWSDIVRKVYNMVGDFIVNDISAGEDDPLMLPLVGELGLTYVAMHKRGTPHTMQQLTDYDDVVAEVAAYFENFSRKADSYGIKNWIPDPGFGFAKTLDQNYELLSGLERLFPERPVLVGISRKSMIYRLFDISPEEALPATQVLHMVALQKGASILRVHDVSHARQTVALYKKLH